MTRIFTICVYLLLIPFCITFSCNCEAVAQAPKKTNTLLWQISGKSLSQPSYLYGTMHVQDNRAFRFNDSVIVKLRECSAFAMELLPDTLVKVLFRDMFRQDSSNRLRNSVSEEEYNRLATELQQRTGLDLEDINTSQPWVLESFLDTTSSMLHKDKPTFLDGYLYRIARTLRKETFGLEMPEEQLSKFADVPFEQQIEELLEGLDASPPNPAQIDSLISIYSDGRLDELELIARSDKDSTELQSLLRRNHTMVKRLLPLMERHTVFVAVGAAHLPGEEGLIDLLRKEGYTVTPVPATFNGPVDIPEDIFLDDPWYTLHSEAAACSIDLPSEPVPYRMEGESVGVSMSIYPDLGTGIVYFVSHLTLPTVVAEENMATFFDKFGQEWAGKRDGKIVFDSSIVHDGFLGKEFDILQKQAHLRVRIFLRQNILSMFIAHTGAANYGSHDINRFFSSVRFMPLPELGNAEQTLTSEKGAFTMLMPDTPRMEVVEDEANGIQYTTTLYMAFDKETSGSYFAGYGQYSSGYFLRGTPFQLAAENMAQKIGGNITSSQDTVWEGYPMYKFYVESSEQSFLQARLIIRGSRMYMVFVLSPTNDVDSEAANRWLNSFHFTDFQLANWQPYTAPDTTFRALFPALPIIERDTANATTAMYTAQDVFSGNSYLALVTEYNPYYHAESEEKFFRDLQEAETDDGDTIYTSVRFSQSGYPGLELEGKAQDSPNAYRTRYVLRHNKLYTLMTYAPREWLHTPVIDTFFQSLQLLPVDDTGSLFTRKIPTWADDMFSRDSATQSRAMRAVNSMEFSQEDLPFLYRVLRHSFPDDNNAFKGVRAQLLHTLHTTYDTTTITFLRELYPTIDDTLDLRDRLLRILAERGTEESLAAMADLLTRLPRNDSMEHYGVFNFISTTDATCRVMFPQILPIVESEGYRANFCDFLAEVLDSGIVTAADIAGIREQFAAYRASTFDAYRAVPENDSAWRQYIIGAELQNIARISGYLADSASIPLLQILATDPDSALALEALCALEQCGQPVSADVWKGYAASPAWRNRVYMKLDIIHRLSRFPEKYRTQAALAEGDLVRFLAEDEEAPADIQILRIHEVPEGKNQGRYFVYKFRYTGNGEETEPATWYVGISGPQPLDKTKMTGAASLTGSYFQTIDEISIEEHITNLLEGNSP
jgi:uncharacterized protein YbaP (TraB family)